MRNLEMYAIKDRLNGFTPPIPFMGEDIAKRYFKDQLIGNPTMFNTPSDFELYYIGSYDSDTGTFICDPKKIKCVQKGASVHGNNQDTI